MNPKAYLPNKDGEFVLEYGNERHKTTEKFSSMSDLLAFCRCRGIILQVKDCVSFSEVK